jgi:hypothetical protein
MDPEIAAANIQRLFRGSSARKRALREREEELIYIGMKPPRNARSGCQCAAAACAWASSSAGGFSHGTHAD